MDSTDDNLNIISNGHEEINHQSILNNSQGSAPPDSTENENEEDFVQNSESDGKDVNENYSEEEIMENGGEHREIIDDENMDEDGNADESEKINGTNDAPSETKIDINLSEENSSVPIAEQNQPLLPEQLAAFPSMRGNLIEETDTLVFKGVWAMNDLGHRANQTSNFEYKLLNVEAVVVSTAHPVSGRYKGTFNLKKPKGVVKYDDDLMIDFAAAEDSSVRSYKVTGSGSNGFGRFKLQGSYSAEDGSMHFYKLFEPVAPGTKVTSPPPAAALKRKRSENPPSRQASSTTPREATRVRPVQAIPAPVSYVQRPTAAASARSISVDTGRIQRPSGPMVKCSDLLKELSKAFRAEFFSEPVDPIKMNIPDYPIVIKEPMDFRTIREKLNAGLYESPENFASDMRLVFRNAMQYNSKKEHPVHIAARELSGKFEDRYSKLNSQLNAVLDTPARLVPPPAYQDVQRSKSNKTTKAPAPIARQASAPIGRKLNNVPRYEPAPAPSSMVGGDGMQVIQDMQREMKKMQDELTKLRAAVVAPQRTHEVLPAAQARVPLVEEALTFEEKKNLISQIHMLPKPKLQKVVEIIQAGMPADRKDGDENEVEIPIDELDTKTLRELQNYVDRCNKKVPAGRSSSGQAGKQSSSSSTANKRPRKDGMTKSSNNSSDALAQGFSSDGMYGVVPKSQKNYQADIDMLPSLDSQNRNRSDSLELDEFQLIDSNLLTTDAWASDINQDHGGVKSEDASLSWGTAIDEKEARNTRELDRKAEEERLIEQRAKAEADRLHALQKDAARQEEERLRAIGEEERRKEDAARQLLERREEERRVREQMQQTVNLDSQQEALMMLDEI